MGGRASAFDAALVALILFVVTAAPLALGAVHPQVVAVLEWFCLLIFLVWIIRSVWVRPAEDHLSAPRFRKRLFGHPVLSTGLELPALFFAVVVAVQLIPLPPSIARIISPSTARIFEESLPGWGSARGVDFSSVGSFLVGPGGDGVVRKLLDAPALPIGISSVGSSWRSLSIYPLATAQRLAVYLSLAGLYIVAVNTFVARRRVELTTRWVLFLGFALSVLGILQRLSWNGKIYWVVDVDPGAAPFGPFINRNHFGAFLAMIVPVAAGMLMDQARRLSARGGGRRTLSIAAHGPEPVARLLLLAFVVAVMGGAIVLSASRGAILALLAALVLSGAAMACRGRIGKTEVVVAVVLLCAAAGISAWLGVGPLADRFHAFGDVEAEPSFVSRLVGWRATLAIIGRFPVLGTGLGTFSESWPLVYPAGTAYAWHEAHNDYLQLVSETGIAGLVVFIMGAVMFAWKYLLPSLTASRESETYASRGVAVGILAISLHSFVDFPLQINACAVLLVVMAAVLVSSRLREGVSE